MRTGVRKSILQGFRLIPALPILTELFPRFRNCASPLSELFIFYFWDLISELQGRAIILYQMGRVGSLTIQDSLGALKIPAYSVHALVQRDPCWIISSPDSRWRSIYLKKHLEEGFNSRKLKVITLIREPVARNVSDFFLRTFTLKTLNLPMHKEISLESLKTYFLENFPHNVTLNWFDVELKQMIGLDVYSVPFPKIKGYKIYKGGDIHPDVLLLKLEKLNECASRAFKEFLGIDQFILQSKNLASNRIYYPIYKKFISTKILPQSYIEKMYASKYAKHFYTDDELNKFREKWRYTH